MEGEESPNVTQAYRNHTVYLSRVIPLSTARTVPSAYTAVRCSAGLWIRTSRRAKRPIRHARGEAAGGHRLSPVTRHCGSAVADVCLPARRRHDRGLAWAGAEGCRSVAGEEG